jgi:beta-mannosidase
LTTVSKRIQTGFRTVKLIQEKDALGSSFILSLNGINVFMRGGNYIPPEMMMDRVNTKTYD